MDVKKMKLKMFRMVAFQGGLFSEEIEVLLAVMFEILGRFTPERGTFRLEGQKLGCDSYEIISFNFPRGEKRHFMANDRGSESLSNYMLGQASTYSRQIGLGSVRHGFNAPSWLDLETDNGRFLAAYYAENGSDDIMNQVYLTIIEVLSILRENDKVLTECCANTFCGEFDNADWVRGLAVRINRMFDEDKLPEIVAWKKWHKNNKNLDKYFI